MSGDSEPRQVSDGTSAPQMSPTLRTFMMTWQPRQRRTLGMLNGLLSRMQSIAQAHPEWAEYDLLTHLLAALHLIIENDRLTGGHTEEQIISELFALVASEHPEDPATVHRAIAEVVVDVLTNARDRRLRLRDRYIRVTEGLIERREQSFAFVRAVGDDESAEPTLRATPEAVNVFQNLYEFDPSDRAAAERYRSTRMLHRREYDEVLTSIDRRATSVHGLRGELEGLVRRIEYNVRDVDYASEVIPHLDDVIGTVAEQVAAEERFAEAVTDLAHHAAPDLARLQRISSSLRGLLGALVQLQCTATSTRKSFEAEQDRQLFTYRRITINPQAQLLDPLLRSAPESVLDVLASPLAIWLGPRMPRLLHLGQLAARCTPAERAAGGNDRNDPFELGESRGSDDVVTPALLAAVTRVLAGVVRPTRLSTLLAQHVDDPVEDPEVRERLPWALAVTIANAYGLTAAVRQSQAPLGFDQHRLVVVSTGDSLAEEGKIIGDDAFVVPRHLTEDP